jgi:hypothetical protein
MYFLTHFYRDILKNFYNIKLIIMAIYRQLNQEIKLIIDVFLLIHFHNYLINFARILHSNFFIYFVFLKIFNNNNKKINEFILKSRAI